MAEAHAKTGNRVQNTATSIGAHLLFNLLCVILGTITVKSGEQVYAEIGEKHRRKTND